MYSVAEISKIVAPIAHSYGIGRLSVFGSYARGEATSGSDIDFHIQDKGTLCGLFQLAGFQIALEEALHVPVDVVTTGSLFDDVYSTVTQEEKVVYEAR